MTVVGLPARTRPRYGVAVVGGAAVLEEAPEESVEALAVRFRAGHEEALGEVYDRWASLVHSYALRALQDTHDAEDVTQQVFVAAWQSRDKMTPGPHTFPAWLIGIARHKISDARAASLSRHDNRPISTAAFISADSVAARLMTARRLHLSSIVLFTLESLSILKAVLQN